MKILISGGRAPYTLELVRILGKQDHEVSIVEFIPFALSSFSKYVFKSYRITAPNKNEEKFIAELELLLRKKSFDLFIPTCEEAIYISKNKKRLESLSQIIVDDFENLIKLHDKFSFIEELKKIDLSYPITHKNIEFIDLSIDYIVKKRLSRFGSHVREWDKVCPLSDGEILQEKIEGLEYSIYAILINGEVSIWSAYSKKYSVRGGASNYFESEDNSILEKWLITIAKRLNLNGQYSFDVFISNDNQIIPIECNPRATSGIHLLIDKLQVSDFFSKRIIPKSLPRPRMLFLAMLLYSLKIKNIKLIFNDMKRAKDIIFDWNDLKPTIGQFLSLFYFVIIAIKKKKSLVEATTLDFEYNQLQ